MKKTNYLMFLLRPIFILIFTELLFNFVGSFLAGAIESIHYQLYASKAFLDGLFFAMYLLVFNANVLTFNEDDRIGQAELVEWAKRGSNCSPFKFVLTTPFFYVEAAIILLISFNFPFLFAYGSMSECFSLELQLSNMPSKTTWAKNVPFLIAVEFLSHIIVVKNWRANINEIADDIKEGKRSISLKTFKHVALNWLIYGVVAYLIMLFVPAVAPWLMLMGKKGVLLLVLWGVIIFLAFFSIFALRAVLKRKSFIKKLKEYCQNNSLALSEIVKPYKSVLFDQEGFNFTVEKNGKKYDCKFVSTIFPGSPLALADSGAGIKHFLIRFIKIQISSYKKEFNFSFESENRKILLLVPTPKKVLVTVKNSKLTEADAGEKLGDYTLYNATTFLNALDRDCV